MSQPFKRYGAFAGVAGGDCRVEIGGKGRKNILAVTVSYQLATLAAPVPGFAGRLVIVEGQLGSPPSILGPPSPDYYVGAEFNNQKILFDVRLSTVGPHSYFYPIAQQEGSAQSDEDAFINIILCIGMDTTWHLTPPPLVAGNLYIPTVTVSGQTIFANNGGAFA